MGLAAAMNRVYRWHAVRFVRADGETIGDCYGEYSVATFADEAKERGYDKVVVVHVPKGTYTHGWTDDEGLARIAYWDPEVPGSGGPYWSAQYYTSPGTYAIALKEGASCEEIDLIRQVGFFHSCLD